jgi:hypothetical protein
VTEMTSGSDSREARTLDDPVMAFELDREVDLLRREPGYGEFGRSSKTLGKGPNFRLVLTAARAGVELGNDDAEAPMAMQVLSGAVHVERAGDVGAFGPGTAIWFSEGGGWAVSVQEDAAIVLSIGWPGSATGEEQSHGRA